MHSYLDPYFDNKSPFKPIQNSGNTNKNYLTTKDDFVKNSKVCIVGAGGLGCELIKNFAMIGFHKITIIDMDTIELTNLNRQFLFRNKDIGRYKAEVCAEFVKRQMPHLEISHFNTNIMEQDEEFWDEFQVIVAGLDNADARSWLNKMVHDLVQFHPDGRITNQKLYIDGGTEGFLGQARVIIPFQTGCFECTREMANPNTNKVPLCTLADTPRTPQHCILYAFVKMWNDVNPYNCKFEADEDEHVEWVYQKALERAAKFNIEGVTKEMTLGTCKNIIPAVASTNAIIASICSNEAFKFVTQSLPNMNNYYLYSGEEGAFGHLNKIEKKVGCIVCDKDIHYKSYQSSLNMKDLVTLLTDEFNLSGDPQIMIDQEYLNVGDSLDKTIKDLLDEEVISDESGGEVLIIDANRNRNLYIYFKIEGIEKENEVHVNNDMED